jgi:signal peptidase I
MVRIVVLVAMCTVIFRFDLLPIRVEGVSMLPTYRDHGIHVINRLAYISHPPRRGDVVAIRYSGIHLMLMKRVVGLPGESIAFREGQLFINGQALEEPYVKNSCDWEIPAETIGPDEYYVVGDNRSMPEADHTKGRAQLSRIVGKLIL